MALHQTMQQTQTKVFLDGGFPLYYILEDKQVSWLLAPHDFLEGVLLGGWLYR